MIDADSLVVLHRRHFGRFAATPLANPLDAYPAHRRAWANFRTKEWAGFTLVHPDLFGSMILQDAKYLASSEIYVYDRASGELAQRAANAPGGSLRLPAKLADAAVALHQRGYRLAYNFEPGRVRVMVRIDPAGATPGINANLVLDAAKASPPLVVSARLPGGRDASLYTNKIVYPAAGAIEVGGRRYEFDPARDCAILDEHKSRLPYRTEWTWGTFAMPAPGGGFFGANFAARPQFDDQEEESCLWTPAAAEPLARISFEPSAGDDLSPWTVRSADGRLDVTFTPEGAKGVSHQLGLASIDYQQRFGSYSGSLRAADAVHSFEGVHGVLEHMKARL
ncbi:MAG: DUF2804 domain-containing protein [Bifidobacteriaceae bacterium]|jgi:hypothetical protein|nr:DUF2804 domain-containing protein [Bifidobacteriaceae bacterium]